jgi:RNA polymerase sigma-70 factor (TIGR02960 family)
LPVPARPEPALAAPALAVPALPEPTGAGDAPPWLEPYPDHLLDHLPDQQPRPRVRYDSTQAISLGFITALQQLPPRQRAALVLCDVVGYDAAEVAQMLDTTQDAINSALTRARVTVDNHLADCGNGTNCTNDTNGTGRPARRLDPAAVEQLLVADFIDALEHADLDALIDLLDADVKLSMPPAMLEYRGIESARRVFAAVAFRYGRSYRVVPTRANGQPAFGLYLADPHASVYRAYSLLVITTAGDRITVITAFNTTIMARFGLPRTLPETD